VSIADTLRRLDVRAFGTPRSPSVADDRKMFIACAAVTLALIATFAPAGSWKYAGGIGAPVVLTIGTGIRWYRATRGSRD
jgi:hypothetical protein